MTPYAAAFRIIDNEAHALLSRLDRLEPFALHIPMVPAASIPVAAQIAIEHHLIKGHRKLRGMVTSFISWLQGNTDRLPSVTEVQRRYSFLKLRFNAILAQLDIFSDVLNQRSEHETGVWLSGLDAFAADALHIEGGYYQTPPVICYLDRGPGAAIRRARTRLPGGEQNPVAVIRIPRERMIGSGIASSLVHEVGHQAAALLGLVGSLRPILKSVHPITAGGENIWGYWERWISEIIADLWAVARLGAIATLGLMSVVSLPKPFVFRLALDDPHPAPWIRVKLSCALGQNLYPHPQWKMMAAAWDTFYPTTSLQEEKHALFNKLESLIPDFIKLLLGHRPKSLHGETLLEAFSQPTLHPVKLAETFRLWRKNPTLIYAAPPTLFFAVIGQAKVDDMIGPEEEAGLIADLLKYWALKSTLDTSEICSTHAVKPVNQLQPQISQRHGLTVH